MTATGAGAYGSAKSRRSGCRAAIRARPGSEFRVFARVPFGAAHRVLAGVDAHLAAGRGKCVDLQHVSKSCQIQQHVGDFLFDRVYLRGEARSEQEKALGVIRALFGYYLEHPDEIPEEYHRSPGDLPTRVADYVAGMTDRYALRTHERLFLPRGWLL